jgi:hypothetical protein
MISATRREILEKLGRLSELAPDMRFGQLVANLATIAEGRWDGVLWNLEDDKLLSAASQFAGELDRRDVSAA